MAVNLPKVGTRNALNFGSDWPRYVKFNEILVNFENFQKSQWLVKKKGKFSNLPIFMGGGVYQFFKYFNNSFKNL